MWDDVIEEDNVPAQPEPEPEAAPEAAPEPEVEEAPPEIVKGTDPKKLICRHWVRPKFLQYNYLYRYRHNYYDDVINYLDQRNKGLPVEKPRPQEWSERALRTYMAHCQPMATRVSNDRLMRAVSSGARFHRIHSKSVIARKYSSLGFNTVSI